MATEEADQPEVQETKVKFDVYVQLASRIASTFLRGRSGFGALRHFEDIARETVRLVFSSTFFAPPKTTAWTFGLPPDPEFWHFAFRGPARPGYRWLLEGALTTPASYSPPAVWALFWALAQAEHDFLYRFVPFWSHEERLTGHLVTQMVQRIEEFGPQWCSLSGAQPPEARCEIWYADTATAQREQCTGADLGLIVHGRFGSSEDFLKVARFQAKKVDTTGHARIDAEQLEALLEREGLGYYLFYHYYDKREWSPAPTVVSAKRVGDTALPKDKEERERRTGRLPDRVSFDCRDEGCDLATFITFGIADSAVDVGVLAGDPPDAAEILMGLPDPPPSRVLVVTMGDGVAQVDWKHLLRKWIKCQHKD